MNKLNEIKEKIQTMNPEVSEELLDLLFEYVMIRHSMDFDKNVNTCDLQSVLEYVIHPRSYEYKE